MAYGSGSLLVWYVFLKSAKNFLPSGGYLSGASVATNRVHLPASLAGMPPFFGSANDEMARPSGPYILAFGFAATRSLATCTPLVSTTWLSAMQSGFLAAIFDASDR